MKIGHMRHVWCLYHCQRASYKIFIILFQIGLCLNCHNRDFVSFFLKKQKKFWLKLNDAYLQPFKISGTSCQIFAVPVLECDTSVTTAARHILFDQGFLHITVITTTSYIICAMSSLIIHPPATPLSAGSPTKNSFPRAPASQQPQPSSVQHKDICTWSAPQDTRNGALRRGIKAHPKDFFFRIWTINLHSSVTLPFVSTKKL